MAHSKSGMKRSIIFILAPLFLLTNLSSSASERQSPAAADRAADVVLLGGKVYTMDNCRRWAEAVAIRDGKIEYVGSDEHAQSFVGEKTHVQELKGRMVLPGFHDSHVHLMDGGMELAECELDNAADRSAVLQTIKKYAASHKEDKWIRGSGWALPIFPDTNPSKNDLDSVVADRPALLYSQDAHSAWVNSKALSAAGITKDTPDPPRGRIERDSQGEPSGTLREEAIELVGKVMPDRTDAERVAGLARAVAEANRFGITSVQDADANVDVLNTYLELQRQGKLTLKVVTALHTVPSKGPRQVEELVRLRDKYTQGRVRAMTAKIFADGVIESHTASMMKPYTDRPGERGIPNYTSEQLAELVAALSMARFQIHVHAIGDQAIHDTLDAFERCRSISAGLRHEIAHLEVIDRLDVERFRELGVIANCQPIWAYSDPYIVQYTIPLIGKERASELYLFQSLYNSGATIAAGSDWSVSSLNPIDAIQVAVTRQSIEEEGRRPPLIPDERLALSDILAAYTINGAFANHHEQETGSIEIGKAADLIVLDKNLFAVPPSEIHTTKVVLTMLDGAEVFRDESFPQQDLAHSGVTSTAHRI